MIPHTQYPPTHTLRQRTETTPAFALVVKLPACLSVWHIVYSSFTYPVSSETSELLPAERYPQPHGGVEGLGREMRGGGGGDTFNTTAEHRPGQRVRERGPCCSVIIFFLDRLAVSFLVVAPRTLIWAVKWVWGGGGEHIGEEDLCLLVEGLT